MLTYSKRYMLVSYKYLTTCVNFHKIIQHFLKLCNLYNKLKVKYSYNIDKASPTISTLFLLNKLLFKYNIKQNIFLHI